MLLVEIVKNLTVLKSLEFRCLIVAESMENDDLFYKTLSSNIQKGRTESVCWERLVIIKVDGDKSIQKANLLFNFILGSCPNLKAIKIKDNLIKARGGLSLDFRDNHFLQRIELDFLNCRYDFHHEFGKRWRNIKDEIKAENLTL